MGSYSSLEGSGWRGVGEGTGSKCGEAVEWTSSEPKGAEQPLLQPSCWTLDQEASNVGRWNRARPTLDAAYSSVQRAQLAKGYKRAWAWAERVEKGEKRLGV